MIYKAQVTMPNGVTVNSEDLLSLTKLAKKCGKTRQTLQQWANGEARGSHSAFVCVEVNGLAHSTEELLDEFLKKTEPHARKSVVRIAEIERIFDCLEERLAELEQRAKG